MYSFVITIIKVISLILIGLLIIIGIAIWSFSPEAACLFKATSSKDEITDAAWQKLSNGKLRSDTDTVIKFDSNRTDNPALSSSAFFVTVFYPTGSKDVRNEFKYRKLSFSRCGEIIDSHHYNFGKDSDIYLFYRGLINQREYNKKSRKIDVKSEYVDFFVGERHFRIPNAYVGNIYNQNLFSRSSSGYISIRTKAPEFLVAPKLGNLFPSIHVRNRNWINGLGNRIIDIQSSGTLHGLTMVKNGKSGVDRFYELNPDGEINTIIACYSSRQKETACQHRFYRGGIMYTFDHSRSLLANSSYMQERFHQLIDSFEVKN